MAPNEYKSGDLCLMLVGIFSGPRASEAMGFHGSLGRDFPSCLTASPRGAPVEGRLKTKASRALIAVPEPGRPVIEAWRRICPDPSPEALIFPRSVVGSGRGKLYRDTQRTSSSGGFVRSLRGWRSQHISLPFRLCDVPWELTSPVTARSRTRRARYATRASLRPATCTCRS
jgi:hypothetical protein